MVVFKDYYFIHAHIHTHKFYIYIHIYIYIYIYISSKFKGAIIIVSDIPWVKM